MTLQFTGNLGPAQRNGLHCHILVFMLNLMLLMIHTSGRVHYIEKGKILMWDFQEIPFLGDRSLHLPLVRTNSSMHRLHGYAVSEEKVALSSVHCVDRFGP